MYDDAEYGTILETHHLNYLRRKIDGAMKAFKKGGSRHTSFATGDVVRMAVVGTKGDYTWTGPFLVLGVFSPNYILSNGLLRHGELLYKVDLVSKDRRSMEEIIRGVNNGQRLYVDDQGNLANCKDAEGDIVKNVLNYDTRIAHYFAERHNAQKSVED